MHDLVPEVKLATLATDAIYGSHARCDHRYKSLFLEEGPDVALEEKRKRTMSDSQFSRSRFSRTCSTISAGARELKPFRLFGPQGTDVTSPKNHPTRMS